MGVILFDSSIDFNIATLKLIYYRMWNGMYLLGLLCMALNGALEVVVDGLNGEGQALTDVCYKRFSKGGVKAPNFEQNQP